MRTVALALILASCGGGTDPGDGPDGLPVGPPPSGLVRVVLGDPGAFSAGVQGDYRNDGADGLVRLRSDMVAGHDAASQVLAHELGHALGLSHTTDEGCLMLSRPTGAIAALCPSERAFALAYQRTLAVVCTDESMRPHLVTACGVWNAGAHRAILALQP
jgi:hypothetical protein